MPTAVPLGRIPRDLVSDTIVFALSQGGRTVDEIEGETARRYEGDAEQEGHRNEPVWHSRGRLLEFVAKKLKIHPSMWGPGRVSSDFYNVVDQEISKLRKRGVLTDWSSIGRSGILRLARRPDRPVADPVMSRAGNIPVWTEAPADMDRTEESMKRTFLSILTRGRKDNTYKFALARALLDYCQENRNNPARTNEITYEYLSGKFLKYYWHQVCKFRIKQDFHTKSTPMVVQKINEVFHDKNPGSFELLDREDIMEAERRILRTVFGHARSKTSLVVPKFQKIVTGNSAEEIRMFYDYDDDAKKIYLKPEAWDFFNRNYWMLSKSVLLEWSKFLEKINGSLPKLISKLEHYDIRRGPLSGVRNMYLKYTDHCFYCGGRLERGYIHVDHFIPWSYMFDDNEWNLVLACQECNCRKSSSLPQEEFQKMLIKRNGKYGGQIQKLHNSLALLDTGKGWKTEIKNHYTGCRDYGFGIVHLP